MESVTTLTTIRSISQTDHITDLLPHLPLRRIPLQKRSRQRVIDILGTGNELLLTHGTEGVTTSSISEHAAIPIGSVYQFFPDRDALLLSLVELSGHSLINQLGEVYSSSAVSLPQRCSDMVEALSVNWGQDAIGARSWNILLSSPATAQAAGRLHQQAAAALQQALHCEQNHLVDVPQRCTLLLTTMTSVFATSVFAGRAGHSPEPDSTTVVALRKWAGQLLV
ncbi:MAG: TetR/AcrR family transcriptional regulator [Candidatus Nanopelagicales bacterium]|nr:TetR/AcrR family transcriptional regulator [Candidatus Nanopelagicales bacterium]